MPSKTVTVVGMVLLVLTSAGPAAAQCVGGDTACWERKAREADERRDRALQLEQQQHEWADAVAVCRVQTQQVSRTFDAYVSAPGRVSMLGTTEARYFFKKCMTIMGFTTD